MNWRRTWLIARFDLRYSALRLRGLFFLVPFALLWYPLLRNFDRDVSAWFRSGEGLMIASKLYDVGVAKTLFLDNPPLLSAFFLIALSSAPFFTILAAHDQTASDLGNGFFRFLSARCTRLELYVGRYLAALLLLTGAYWVVGLTVALLTVFSDGAEAARVLPYLAQILLTLLLYLMPLVAFAGACSSLCSSAIGALLLGLSAYVAMLLLMWAGNGLFTDAAPFSYLLPSGIREYLFGVDALRSMLASAGLPLYTLAYGWCGYLMFRLRNF